MAIEIERKFLVKGDFTRTAVQADRIVQGYLYTAPDKTVRIRIRGSKAYLTIKGRSDETGVARSEFEYEIPVADADALLSMCEEGVIDKVRYLVPVKEHVWEIDLFHGHNAGLVIAEIELTSEDEVFERPDWLGDEVTGQSRYYNAMLSKHPYEEWSPEERQNNVKENI